MLHPSTQQLIRKLYELTASGGLGWMPGEEKASRLETEGYVVEIAAEPPLMRLLRADGRELERAETSALASLPWPDGDGTYATRMVEMAGRASRIANGAERAVTQVMSSLSAPPKDPAPRAKPIASFGRTQSFAIPASTPPSPKPAAPAPIMSLSARSVQSVEATTPADFRRAVASASPAPKAPQPAQPGPHIYKPWT